MASLLYCAAQSFAAHADRRFTMTMARSRLGRLFDHPLVSLYDALRARCGSARENAGGSQGVAGDEWRVAGENEGAAGDCWAASWS